MCPGCFLISLSQVGCHLGGVTNYSLRVDRYKVTNDLISRSGSAIDIFIQSASPPSIIAFKMLISKPVTPSSLKVA